MTLRDGTKDTFTPSTLLTKCLCGETNGEPEPPGSTFSPQTQPPRGCCLGLAMRKKPVLWPFFALSVGLLTGLTAFRNEYLAPQVHLGKSAFG